MQKISIGYQKPYETSTLMLSRVAVWWNIPEYAHVPNKAFNYLLSDVGFII